MNLQCPNCSSEDTQKLSLLMTQAGLFAKIMRFGVIYAYNIWIPLVTFLSGIAFGFLFAMINGFLGLLVFVGILIAGYMARKWVKTKTRSQFADLRAQVQQDGFRCNRCAHTFIPAT